MSAVINHHFLIPKDRPDCPDHVPWMLWWIVGVHFVWGWGLLFQPQLLGRIVVLIGVDWIAQLGVSTTVLAIILLSVSILAATGLLLERRLHNLSPGKALTILALTLCPQYFIVLAALLSDLNTILAGEFQGQKIETWLLLCALAPVVFGALLHTAAILERYATTWRR